MTAPILRREDGNSEVDWNTQVTKWPGALVDDGHFRRCVRLSDFDVRRAEGVRPEIRTLHVECLSLFALARSFH